MAQATLDVLFSMETHVVLSGGALQRVSPHLVKPQTDQPAPHYTMHSLKRFKPSLYQATGAHDKYVVEPGAHAGSTLESMSVVGMRTMVRKPCSLQMLVVYDP